jgi:hypothetical protein
MRQIIGYLGGERIDYQGYPSKGGILPSDMTQAVNAMRKAKAKQGRQFNTRWNDNDYMLLKDDHGERIIKMKDAWQGRL